MSPTTRVWTDGACKGNPGPGGWAWVTEDGRADFGAEPETTNQRMEITAASRAVSALSGPLEVISDSTYVVGCFNKKWYEGWLARGWKNSQRRPVANRDLWEPFIDAVLARNDVRFTWVKGHSGDRMNEKADRLAVGAVEALMAVDTPEDADDQPLVTGHPIAVLGQRVLKEDDASTATELLMATLTDLRARHPDLTVMTGLRDGAESIAASVARSLRIPYVAILPWPKPAARWSADRQKRFEADLRRAADRAIVADRAPRSLDARRSAMNDRNRWILAVARGSVIIHDGRSADGVELLAMFSRGEGPLVDLDLSVGQPTS